MKPQDIRSAAKIMSVRRMIAAVISRSYEQFAGDSISDLAVLVSQSPTFTE